MNFIAIVKDRETKEMRTMPDSCFSTKKEYKECLEENGYVVIRIYSKEDWKTLDSDFFLNKNIFTKRGAKRYIKNNPEAIDIDDAKMIFEEIWG